MRMVFSADLGMFSQGTMTQKVLIGIPANPWPLSNHCRMLTLRCIQQLQSLAFPVLLSIQLIFEPIFFLLGFLNC